MWTLCFISLSLVSVILLSCDAQVVPIGQFFVGDESRASDSCQVEFKSEKSLRIIRGCYRAQLNKKRACVTTKYHREVEQCCQSAGTDLAVAVAEEYGFRPMMKPCHRIQVFYHNYCIDVPSYSLVEGCPNENGCGMEFPLHSELDLSRENKTSIETRIAINDCLKLKTNIHKGPILPGCYNIESSSVPERRCIPVKRNVPYKICCNKRGIDTGAENGMGIDSKQLFARPCIQYHEIESQYCFDVPFESITECSGLEGKICT